MKHTPCDILQLKVMLREVSPPVWRRIQVPSGITLGRLHDVLQIVMGWTNSHLHQFEAGGVYFSNPRFELDGENEEKVTLEQISRDHPSFQYQYDFGDDWEHDVIIEKTLPRAEGVSYPVCVAGKRACPPEDCGGPPGYVELLKTRKGPRNTKLDPEAFYPADVNMLLAPLRSPSQSVTGHRKQRPKLRIVK